MNDSLRTDIFVRYSPETIACSCIYLSARLLQIPLPNNPAWYSIFGVSEEDMQDGCKRILSIYARRKPDSEALERKVEELKKAHYEAKLRAKLISGTTTPVVGNGASFSPSSRTNSPSRQSPVLDPLPRKKEEAKAIIERSPRVDRTASNHIPSTGGKRKPSPSSSSSPAGGRSRKEASRGGHGSSSSSNGGGSSPPPPSAPLRGGRTPPRGYKESGLALPSSPVRSKSEERRGGKESSSKRHSSHKRKRSVSSRSRSRSPSHRRSTKKRSGSSGHRTSRRKASPGHGEHNHHHHRRRSSSTKASKKERSRETRNHRTTAAARR